MEKCYRNFQNVKCIFWRWGSVTKSCFWLVFQVIVTWPLSQLQNAKDIDWLVKQMKMWIEWRELYLQKQKKCYCLKSLMCCNFCLDQFREFWKTNWNLGDLFLHHHTTCFFCLFCTAVSVWKRNDHHDHAPTLLTRFSISFFSQNSRWN